MESRIKNHESRIKNQEYKVLLSLRSPSFKKVGRSNLLNKIPNPNDQ